MTELSSRVEPAVAGWLTEDKVIQELRNGEASVIIWLHSTLRTFCKAGITTQRAPARINSICSKPEHEWICRSIEFCSINSENISDSFFFLFFPPWSVDLKLAQNTTQALKLSNTTSERCCPVQLFRFRHFHVPYRNTSTLQNLVRESRSTSPLSRRIVDRCMTTLCIYTLSRIKIKIKIV